MIPYKNGFPIIILGLRIKVFKTKWFSPYPKNMRQPNNSPFVSGREADANKWLNIYNPQDSATDIRVSLQELKSIKTIKQPKFTIR